VILPELRRDSSVTSPLVQAGGSMRWAVVTRTVAARSTEVWRSGER
jgi:hypothetical protein